MRPVAATLALLFIALCHSSLAQSAGEDAELVVAAGAPLAVACALGVEERAAWRRDGGPPPADMRASESPAPAPQAGLLARLAAGAARAAHAGRYTCSPRARAVRVRVLPPPAGPAPGDGWKQVEYQLLKPLLLNCSAGPGADLSGAQFSWTVNDTALERSALAARARLEDGGARLVLERALEDDFGNYSCLANGELALRWRVRAVPVLRLPKDSNVVAGQKLKLSCRVTGKPYPAVSWLRLQPGAEPNVTDALEHFGARARVLASPAGVEGGELVVDAAEYGDDGEYACAAPGAPAADWAVTRLRVKDMYAALWPFLGICAEVFVLCAIILVYEKRRTKPECDDSDTDNHEQ